MREREAAMLASACMLLSVAVLRMFAPSLPFDWMTLVLVVAAAAAVALPGLRPQGPPGRRGAGAFPGQGGAPTPSTEPTAMEALRARMAAGDWQASGGGMFDALRTLRTENTFAAVCAARGLLMMLAKEARPLPEDMATLSLLLSAIDEAARAGEDAADPRAVDDLFGFALRALGRFQPR